MRLLFGLLTVTLLWTERVNGQTAEKIQSTDTTSTEKFYSVDKPAEFPGGFAKFYGNYISKNIKYPKDAKELGVEGKVQVEFVIESTGEIRQNSVRVVSGIHPSCDNEAVRIIEQSPRWKPGFSSELNKNVAQRMIVPIFFKLAR